MTFGRALIGRLGWAIGGAILFYVVAWPTEFPSYPVVIVPAARIIELEPPEIVRWRDRITHHYIGPTQVAQALGGATEAVQDFCRPVTVAVTDTVYVKPMVLVRSGVTHDGWWVGKGSVDLVALRNTGDLLRFSYSTRPGWDFIASGDSLIVRYPRLALPRQVVETAALPVGVLLVCHFFGC